MGGSLGRIFLGLATGGVSEGVRALSKSGGSNNPISAPSAPLPMPQAPDTSAIADQAQKTIQRKKANMSQTIYTSPLGVGGDAGVVRKTLTGQ